MRRYWKRKIFNTGQGSQFTAANSIGVLKVAKVRTSMDGRSRFLGRSFIERLRRSLKHEAVYLHELASGLEAQGSIAGWIAFYNEERAGTALGGRSRAEGQGGLTAIPQNRESSTAPARAAGT